MILTARRRDKISLTKKGVLGMARIGVISDTHGSLSSKIFDIFKDVDLIIHAGDIGKDEIITELETIARVSAVHGNIDGHDLLNRYPRQMVLDEFGLKIHVSHKDSHSAGSVDIAIQGHTHLAEIKRELGKLYINPGKASDSVVILEIDDRSIIDSKIVFL